MAGADLPGSGLPVARADHHAAAGLAAVRQACEPAPPGKVKTFLLKLGAMATGNLTAADLGVKIAVYLEALPEVPIGALTVACQRRAGERFKFFPSFAEWSAFVAEERAALEAQSRRLQTLPAPGNPLVGPLSARLPQAVLNAWIAPLVVQTRADRAVIRCPTEMHRAWVRTHYADAIAAVLKVATLVLLVVDEAEPLPVDRVAPEHVAAVMAGLCGYR